MMFALIISIHCYVAGSSQNNQARRRNKTHPVWRGRHKTYFIFRLHDCLNRKSDEIYKKKSSGFL